MQIPTEIFYHILSFLPESEIDKFELPDFFWRSLAREKLSISSLIFDRKGKFQLTSKQRYFQLYLQTNFSEGDFGCGLSSDQRLLIAARYATVEQISSLICQEIAKEVRILCHKILLKRNPPRLDKYLENLPQWLEEEVKLLKDETYYQNALFRRWVPFAEPDIPIDCHLYWQSILSEDCQVRSQIFDYLIQHLEEGCLDVSLAYIFSYLLSSPEKIYFPILENFFSDCRSIKERIQQSATFFELLLCKKGKGKFIPSEELVREWLSYLADASLCSHDKKRISYFLRQGISISLSGILKFVQSPSPKNSSPKFEILRTFSEAVDLSLKKSSFSSVLLFKICLQCGQNFDFDCLDFFLSRIPKEKRGLIQKRLFEQNLNCLVQNYLNKL